jgi:hypothetical protein
VLKILSDNIEERQLAYFSACCEIIHKRGESLYAGVCGCPESLRAGLLAFGPRARYAASSAVV